MDKLKESYQNLQYFKDWLEGREESEIVLISVENLNWLTNSIDYFKEKNKSLLKELSESKKKNKYEDMITEVYLLEVSDENEETIEGVYSTKEKAEVRKSRLEEGLTGWVIEYEVDKNIPKISDLRKQTAIKTAPKHGLLDLYKRNSY